MTPQEKFITACRAEIGYHETGANVTKYAQTSIDEIIYNGYSMQGEPWCDFFYDYMMAQVFGTERGMKMTYQFDERSRRYMASPGCARSAELYQAAGAWHHSPEPGDQIFFFSGGEIGHTGIVESVGTGKISTIEGNYSDSVCRVNHFLNESTIAGYGRPNWSLAADTADDAPFDDPQSVVVVQPDSASQICFEANAQGPYVAAFQGLAIYLGFDPGRYRDRRGIGSGVDGDAGLSGSSTNRALKQAVDSGKFSMEKLQKLKEALQ